MTLGADFDLYLDVTGPGVPSSLDPYTIFVCLESFRLLTTFSVFILRNVY